MDLPTWPLFILVGIALIALFLGRLKPTMKLQISISMYDLSKVMIVAVLIGAVFSLWHDSTTALNLHF